MRGGSMEGFLLGRLGLTGTLLALALAGAPAEPDGTRSHPETVSAAAMAAGLSIQEQPGRDTFRQLCAPCHGNEGHGNGPAAVAFNPPPADFTNPDGLAKLTDDQIIEVITKGRGAMPAWGPILTQEQFAPLVAYLRELSRGEGRPDHGRKPME